MEIKSRQDRKKIMSGKVRRTEFFLRKWRKERAILNDRKTVTRRVVKLRPFAVKQDETASCWCGHFVSESGKVLLDKPPCRPGNILYVRETWKRNP